MTTLVALHQPGFGTVIGSDRMASNMVMKHFMPGGKWAWAMAGRSVRLATTSRTS